MRRNKHNIMPLLSPGFDKPPHAINRSAAFRAQHRLPSLASVAFLPPLRRISQNRGTCSKFGLFQFPFHSSPEWHVVRYQHVSAKFGPTLANTFTSFRARQARQASNKQGPMTPIIPWTLSGAVPQRLRPRSGPTERFRRRLQQNKLGSRPLPRNTAQPSVSLPCAVLRNAAAPFRTREAKEGKPPIREGR